MVIIQELLVSGKKKSYRNYRVVPPLQRACRRYRMDGTSIKVLVLIDARVSPIKAEHLLRALLRDIKPRLLASDATKPKERRES